MLADRQLPEKKLLGVIPENGQYRVTAESVPGCDLYIYGFCFLNVNYELASKPFDFDDINKNVFEFNFDFCVFSGIFPINLM